jgi:ubiquinone/menaquinone biosynthesis C-methylase UbiE
MNNQTHANSDVLTFYKRLPFNYGNPTVMANSIRKRNPVMYYKHLEPLLKSGINVLDVGCGAGWFVNSVNYHYKNYGTLCSGIDFNKLALEQAKQVALNLGNHSNFVII